MKKNGLQISNDWSNQHHSLSSFWLTVQCTFSDKLDMTRLNLSSDAIFLLIFINHYHSHHHHLFSQVGHDKAQSVAQCYSPPSTEQFRNPELSEGWTGGDWLSCCSRTDLREDRWTPEINTIFISPDNNFSIRSYLSIREAFKNKISSIDFWIFFIFNAFTKHFYIASSIFLGWWWKPPKC